MRRIKFILYLLMICLLLTACAQRSEAAPESVPPQSVTEETAEPTEEQVMPLGSFTAQTLTGETLTEAIFSDADLTVVNVWGTYCGPCKAEMPILGKLHTELGDVQVLGIVIDVINQQGEPDPAQIELALELCDASEVTYPNLILNESLAQLGFAGVQGVPATMFVDRNGNVVGMGFYGALNEENWRQVIAERLEMAAS